MSITTTLGDDGYTRMRTGDRVRKDDPLMEALGTVDELNAFLADTRHHVATDRVKELLETIQEDFYCLLADLATIASSTAPENLDETAIQRITGAVKELEEAVPIQGFVKLGSTSPSAKLDICRTVCRRAERRICAAYSQGASKPHLLAYINRLSDLLFMMARYEEAAIGALRYQ